jgi:hypothetical protein
VPDLTWIPSLLSRIQKTEHAVETPWLAASEEIQEGAISRENDGFNFCIFLIEDQEIQC